MSSISGISALQNQVISAENRTPVIEQASQSFLMQIVDRIAKNHIAVGVLIAGGLSAGYFLNPYIGLSVGVFILLCKTVSWKYGQDSRLAPIFSRALSNEGQAQAAAASVSSASSIETAPNAPMRLFGNITKEALDLFREYANAPAMNKQKMSGSCDAETTRMEEFLKSRFGMHNIEGRYFVHGVRAFRVGDLGRLRDDEVLTFVGENGNAYRFLMKELRDWQRSFRVFASRDVFQESTASLQIAKALGGESERGEEAFNMKFLIRISENPVFSHFDGAVIDRNPNENQAPIYLVSVCGADFAGRHHDEADIKKYIKNWKAVYQTGKNGSEDVLLVQNGRDFIPLGVKAELDAELLKHDLKKMIKLRLDAQERLGIKVVGECGIGLGVFAGGAIGIDNEVRSLSAKALKEVLEENEYHFTMVCCSLPIFRSQDNYHVFEREFGSYRGRVPVAILDQDMNRIATIASKKGFSASILNPADSHGIVGEYWQNRGPGTEEKLALTTAALLTQHHVINPCVQDPLNYRLID